MENKSYLKYSIENKSYLKFSIENTSYLTIFYTKLKVIEHFSTEN